MRNDTTDRLGVDLTKHFKKSGLSVKKYIDMMVKKHKCFDTTDTTFHFIHWGQIVSAYFVDGKWYAKY